MSLYILLQNFLFTSKDEHSPLKAIDFGLSDYVKPDERLNDIVESAYYVAPEVLHRSYGPEADMWSIGAIAYILLCGSRPFWARSESGHPWLANYHDVKIPLDMIIYKLVKAYICSSSLRKAALGWHGGRNAVYKCNAMQLKKNKPFSQSVVAVAKNSTEAMKDSRVLDYAHMVMVFEANFLSSLEFKDEIYGILYISQMSTLQYRKLDFEEFWASAISVHQLERMESWEQHARSTYELFDKDGKKPYYDRGISLGMLFFPSLLWLLTESSHKLAISWHLILATKVSAKSTRNWRANNFQLMMLTILCFILHITR
ncbi:hypothetical protein RHMOL_Rhmol11G0240900 [Rhododendron molle]|uniref:Uncharacterized protein n=1 Tax=Rhododendron molle TaxID=49168 RepID=A0ACC0LWQ9_RHOML|nr:hypothetical protein RHMOL_Rhmol11G0240900 [Rhododendron molle]